VSDGEVNNAIENIMQSKMLSREEFEAALGREGLAFDEYKETIRKQILHTKIINNAVKSKVIITDSEIKKQYELDAAQNTGKKKYQLRNILMDNEEQLAAVKKLLDENKNFADLAKQYSMAPNASDGGELGLFDINNFSQILKENISKLEKGEYTDVISTPQGFQVFYVDDIVSGGGKTYEQARDEIHKTLYEKAADAKFQSWLESLKKKAHIKIML
jgi:peptidyl-prolyl cis-trans isomerase SurA